MITRPEESYRLWRVVVCDLETSKKPLPGCENTTTMGCNAKKTNMTIIIIIYYSHHDYVCTTVHARVYIHYGVFFK
jgi:hypothetical protein